MRKLSLLVTVAALTVSVSACGRKAENQTEAAAPEGNMVTISSDQLNQLVDDAVEARLPVPDNSETAPPPEAPLKVSVQSQDELDRATLRDPSSTPSQLNAAVERLTYYYKKRGGEKLVRSFGGNWGYLDDADNRIRNDPRSTPAQKKAATWRIETRNVHDG